jgi:hypothetical protein
MLSRSGDTEEDHAGTVDQAEGLDVEDFSTRIEQLPFASPVPPRGRETSPPSWNQDEDVEDMPTQMVQSSFTPPPARETSSRYWSQDDDVEDMPTQAVQPSFAPPDPSPAREAPRTWSQNNDVVDLPTQIGPQPFAQPPLYPGNEGWKATPELRKQPDDAARIEAQPFPATAQWKPAPAPWSPPAPLSPPEPVQAVAPQPRRRRRGLVLVIVLLILLLLGGGGYLAYTLRGGHLPVLQATQSTIKTTKLNIQVNYAGIDITILNVQQAQNFLNDPQSASNGMLRLNLQEQNSTTTAINWNYNQIAHLQPQEAKAIAPVYVNSATSIAPNATLSSFIDFPIANGGNLSKLLFELGGAQEAQLQIPLTGQAQIDKYKPQTSQQNGTLLYFGLNWTLTSATISLSIPGQQAPSGQEFLTLTLKVDNTLSQEAITGSPFDYLRVQAGSQTVSPVETTIPVSFATGEMGKTGTATFLIPQNSQNCTLILLSQDPGTSGQATTDFQVG